MLIELEFEELRIIVSDFEIFRQKINEGLQLLKEQSKDEVKEEIKVEVKSEIKKEEM
jgi:hypothetical protein